MTEHEADDLEMECFDEFCERARKNSSDYGMASDVIHELLSAIEEKRPVKENYIQAINQFLALRDVLEVQGIEWFPNPDISIEYINAKRELFS